MSIGRNADQAALRTYKAQLDVLEALGPVKYPHPNAELTARLRSTIASLEWSIKHAFYGVEAS